MTSIPALGIQRDLLHQLATQHDAMQQMWLSGYLYALAARDNSSLHTGADLSVLLDQPHPHITKTKITILFGSQTGNSKKVAQKAFGRIQSAGFDVEIHDLNDYATKNLKNEKCLLLIISTQGEGVPPVSAESFYHWLHSSRAPELSDLKYSVCALGDSSYLKFCQTGKDIDQRLAQLGARALYERMDCDADYEDAAEAWLEAVISKLPANTGSSNGVPQLALNQQISNHASLATYDRKLPFQATVLEKIRLDGRGSTKETWHIELSLEGAHLPYEPGDALGIYPKNPAKLVKEILYAAALDGRKIVHFEGESGSLYDILLQKAEITTLNRSVLEKFAEWTGNKTLHTILNDNQQLKNFLWGRNIADLLREYPAAFSEQSFVKILRKLQPRLYSIASSANAHPDEVHLTIASVRYLFNDRMHWGAASTFVADQIEIGDTVPVFVEQNAYFKLPADDKDIIMVGAGTGVAPFRAFVEERAERGAKGRNWLFFGNPHFETDFLYQTEWLNLLKKGQLDRLDVAFSRDQAEKYYVQHRMQHRSKLLYERLQDGAYFYVCGDKSRMAPDVKAALTRIVATESGKGEAFAEEYIKSLQQQRRYLEDVY